MNNDDATPATQDELNALKQAEKIRNVARKKVTTALWRRAELDWILKPHQRPVYTQIKEACTKPNTRFVLHASRRWGKTYLLAAIAIEFALTHPNATILYCGSTQKAVKAFIVPAFDDLIHKYDCPPDIRPVFKVQAGQIVFSNGARIMLTGLDGGRMQKLRGMTAHFIIVDEAGFIDDLTTAVKDVLAPMAATTGGPTILASNSPLTPDHPFRRDFAQQAEIDGLYCKQTIHDATNFTIEDIDRFAKDSGGYESTTFKREYLCAYTNDTENAVIPEWTDMESKLVRDDIEKPEFYFPSVSLDLGFVDFTGVLFGYWHFKHALLYIEDELLLKGTNSEKLVKACREKEIALWTADPPKKPFRVADGQAFTINDLNTVHRYPVSHPEKGMSLESQVNAIRLDVQNMRLMIHPRCVRLIAQLRNGTWNKGRTEYLRDKINGHYDLLAALQYLVKHANRRSNPFPAYYQIDTDNTVIKNRSTLSPSHQKLKKLWGPRAD